MTRFGWTMSGIAIGAVLTTGGIARAGNPCIDDAKETFIECKGDCKEDFQVAKDNCRNKDHQCMEDARAKRDNCVESTSLPGDLAACRATFQTARQACLDGDPTLLDGCIDHAQVQAYLCRRLARVTARPALILCRQTFIADAKACPPPVNPSDVIDPVQCRLDAVNVYLGCKLGCRNSMRAQKDLCRNKDHACMEACRADRQTCRQPVEDALDAAIAACNATRDQNLPGCNGNETCIIGVLVDAFLCRDQAREDAKPGFAACAQQFQACAVGPGPNGPTGCPPAS